MNDHDHPWYKRIVLRFHFLSPSIFRIMDFLVLQSRQMGTEQS